MRLLRVVLISILTTLPALACNLTGSTSPTGNTSGSAPVIGLQPVSGPPGTVITISVSGFTPGMSVNLLVLPEGVVSPVVLARDLVITAAGSLNFALTVPTQIGTTTLTRTTALTLTVATADQRESATAVFVVLITAATPGTSTLAATPTQGQLTGGGAANFFITSPAINSEHNAGQITVTGSGASFNNQVIVQLQDINNNVIASGVATIQGASGAVGTWQVTIPFTQPAQRASGYIYAYTVNAAGQLAQAASIPVIYSGGAVTTAMPVVGQTPTFYIPILVTSTPVP